MDFCVYEEYRYTSGMNWGTQMKTMYISGVVILLLLLIGVPVYFKYFNNPPSCSDNKQNQDERGVDCSGVCAKLCPFEARDPIILFERLYEASRGSYTAVALVENPNQGVFTRKLAYDFKIYDKDNVLLSEIPGTTFAPPGRTFPIFVSQILTGNRIASKITFAAAVGSSIPWERGVWKEPDVKVMNVTRKVVNGASRVEADIMNNEVYTLKNIEIAAIVYDSNGNARDASATVVEEVLSNSKAHITFAWNSEFAFDVSKVDIIPRLVPREWMTEN